LIAAPSICTRARSRALVAARQLEGVDVEQRLVVVVLDVVHHLADGDPHIAGRLAAVTDLLRRAACRAMVVIS
jgi:hypothetical protein